jgi:hypothetical protein
MVFSTRFSARVSSVWGTLANKWESLPVLGPLGCGPSVGCKMGKGGTGRELGGVGSVVGRSGSQLWRMLFNQL